jgi:hypothetical protein
MKLWDVVYQGIFCCTIEAADRELALLVAQRVLQVDDDQIPEIEVWEVD